MKNLIFALVTILSLNAHAQVMSFCNAAVEAKAVETFKVDFPSEVIIAVESNATHYVGFHTKMYTAKIASAAGVTSYEVQVFEFETESTRCEIDSIKLVIEVPDSKPNIHPVKPVQVPTLQITNNIFAVGALGSFAINVQNLPAGYTHSFQIANLHDFEGASFDSSAQEFVWVPTRSVVGFSGIAEVPVEVVMTLTPEDPKGEMLVVIKRFSLYVISRF